MDAPALLFLLDKCSTAPCQPWQRPPIPPRPRRFATALPESRSMHSPLSVRSMFSGCEADCAPQYAPSENPANQRRFQDDGLPIMTGASAAERGRPAAVARVWIAIWQCCSTQDTLPGDRREAPRSTQPARSASSWRRAARRSARPACWRTPLRETGDSRPSHYRRYTPREVGRNLRCRDHPRRCCGSSDHTCRRILHGPFVDGAPSRRDHYRAAPAVLAPVSALGF